MDWGGTESGMQPGRKHCKAIMSLDGDYTNVGVALVWSGRPGKAVDNYEYS